MGGQIALFLKLPIYLDSIGTVFVAAVLGPFYGMLPNLLSGLLIVFAEPLYRLFTTDNQVVEIGVYMMRYLMPSYFLYVAIGILSGALRGAGKVLVPVILTCGGVCIMRITWMLAVLPVFPGIETIMLSYPVSWGITAVLFVIYYVKRFPKTENEKK